MFQLAYEEYSIYVEDGRIPAIYEEYARRASLGVEMNLEAGVGEPACMAVARAGEWPFLVAAFRYSPGGQAGFSPGLMLVPETDVLFLGAGTMLRAFDLRAPGELWEDVTDTGFWSWARYGRTVVMSAELELVAWDLHGKKRWTAPVEPPWSYSVEDGTVVLDIMGKISRFSLMTGPDAR